MKKLMIFLVYSMLFFVGQYLYATTYENGLNTMDWKVYDNTPSGATITKVHDNVLGEFVTYLQGIQIQNGFRLGNWERRVDAWNNTSEKTLQWKMKVENSYIIYIRVITSKGNRYLTYSAADNDRGISGGYIQFGLGSGSADGTWQEFSRDLEEDLRKFEPDNELLAVNAFLVRGSVYFSKISLIDAEVDPSEYKILKKGGFNYYYDENARLIKKIKDYNEIKYYYNENGQLNYISDLIDMLQQFYYKYKYDQSGRLISQEYIDQDDAATTHLDFIYDSNGNLAIERGYFALHHSFNPEFDPAATIDAKNIRRVIHIYDDQNRLQITYPNNCGINTSLSYFDAKKNLVPSQYCEADHIVYTYNNIGLLAKKYIYFSFKVLYEKYTYDNSKRVIKVEKGKYDISISPPESVQIILTYTYDTYGHLIKELYDTNADGIIDDILVTEWGVP